MADELALRLADVAALAAKAVDEDGEPTVGTVELVSAIGHALSGSPGCLEPDEWQADREAALDRHREWLGL